MSEMPRLDPRLLGNNALVVGRRLRELEVRELELMDTQLVGRERPQLRLGNTISSRYTLSRTAKRALDRTVVQEGVLQGLLTHRSVGRVFEKFQSPLNGSQPVRHIGYRHDASAGKGRESIGLRLLVFSIALFV